MRYKIITEDNPKMVKTNKKKGVLSTVLHLAPGSLSGHDVCPFSDSCRDVCLHTAGNPAWMNSKNTARIDRTRLMFNNRAAFEVDYMADIETQQEIADGAGIKAIHRPNGTSDIRWEEVRFGEFCNTTIFEILPGVQFMDYTKWPVYLRQVDDIPNYHLTFSLSDSNEARALTALDCGYNITAVFAVRQGAILPDSFWGLPVIDGDEHDLRFTDPPGVVVGLRAKGDAIGCTSGFVRHPHTGDKITSTAQWVDADSGFADYKFSNMDKHGQDIDMPGA